MKLRVRHVLPLAIGLLLITEQTAQAQIAGAWATGAGAPNMASAVPREQAIAVTIDTTRMVRPGEAYRTPGGYPVPSAGALSSPLLGSTSRRPDLERGIASGVILSSDGEIVTNAHAVAEAERVVVRLADGRRFDARVVGLDRLSDIALLKIDAHGLPAAGIGRSSQLEPGEWVAAIGAPFGLSSSVTVGIVSAAERYLPGSAIPVIQTDVAINPGSSGGPLFNARGEVVGINSMLFSRNGGYMGVSFAIPIDIAVKIIGELRSSGRILRGQLGVKIQEVSVDLARSFGMPTAGGALVLAVKPGSAGERGGLRSGDIITAIDDRPDATFVQLQQQVAGAQPGQRLHLSVWRKSSVQRIAVVASEAPSDLPARIEKTSNRRDERLGMNLSEPSLARRADLDIDSGLVVLEAHGLAWRHGVQADDVVIALGDAPVRTLTEFDAALAAFPRDRPIALLVLRDGSLNYIVVEDSR